MSFFFMSLLMASPTRANDYWNEKVSCPQGCRNLMARKSMKRHYDVKHPGVKMPSMKSDPATETVWCRAASTEVLQEQSVDVLPDRHAVSSGGEVEGDEQSEMEFQSTERHSRTVQRRSSIDVVTTSGRRSSADAILARRSSHANATGSNESIDRRSSSSFGYRK